MGYPGQQTHPEVQRLMEQGVTAIREAGRIAGVSCPDSLVPKFLEMRVQYFHSNVNTLLQSASIPYLEQMRREDAAGSRGGGTVAKRRPPGPYGPPLPREPAPLRC